jgi:hypothetical protein
VITGFNTDIEYQGITYHVQTEDKGLDTPLILSLVYDRGTILASKRSPYDDLISEGFDEKALAERLQKQHKLICAAVSAGRIEDLKRMTMKESALKQKKLVTQKEIKPAAVELEKSIPRPEQPLSETVHREISTTQFVDDALDRLESLKNLEPVSDLPSFSPEEKIEVKEETEAQRLDEESSRQVTAEHAGDEPIIEAVQIVEEETILPADAVEIITDVANTENPLDNKLKVGLLTDTNFKGGERKTIKIMVWRATMEKGLNGAHIMVKIVGTSFRPMIFHAKTDSNGVATVHLQLPRFRAGRAAFLIKAMSEGEEAELRRIITQG